MTPAVARISPPAAERRGLEVTVVSSFREMLGLEPLWNGLCERAGIDHPFLTHEWIRSWWECFGPDEGLRVLLLREGSRPVGLVPLMADRTRSYGIELSRLGFPWNAHTPRLDLLVPDHRSAEAFGALWSHLRDRKDWDVLQLCQLPEESSGAARLAEQAVQDGFLVGRWASARSPYLSIEGGWDDYVASLSRKSRGNVRKRLRHLQSMGEVELEVLDGSEGLEEALDEGFRLEAAAWKGDAGTAILSRPESRAFYRLLARRAAARGWLRLFFLKLDGRRIAFNYALLYRDILYCLKVGYDPELARSSPGNVLFFLALRDAFDRGLREFDFLGDAEPWKLDWTLQARPHHWLFVLRPSPRTRLVHFLKFGLAPRLRDGSLVEPVPARGNHATA